MFMVYCSAVIKYVQCIYIHHQSHLVSSVCQVSNVTRRTLDGHSMGTQHLVILVVYVSADFEKSVVCDFLLQRIPMLTALHLTKTFARHVHFHVFVKNFIT